MWLFCVFLFESSQLYNFHCGIRYRFSWHFSLVDCKFHHLQWTTANQLIHNSMCITDVVRIIVSYSPQGVYSIYYPNPRNMARVYLTFTTVNLVDRMIWNNIHLGTAILCACLPTYRPLIVQCTTISTSFIKRYDSIFSNKSRSEKLSLGGLSQNTYPSSRRPSYKQLDQHHDDQAIQVKVSGGRAPGDMNAGIAPHSTGVRMTIEIVWFRVYENWDDFDCK